MKIWAIKKANVVQDNIQSVVVEGLYTWKPDSLFFAVMYNALPSTTNSDHYIGRREGCSCCYTTYTVEELELETEKFVPCVYCAYHRPNKCPICNGTKKDFIHAKEEILDKATT